MPALVIQSQAVLQMLMLSSPLRDSLWSGPGGILLYPKGTVPFPPGVIHALKSWVDLSANPALECRNHMKHTIQKADIAQADIAQADTDLFTYFLFSSTFLPPLKQRTKPQHPKKTNKSNKNLVCCIPTGFLPDQLSSVLLHLAETPYCIL